MRKFIIFIAAAAVFSILTGCGYKEGVRQPDHQSYIWFSGNTDGAVVIIDDSEPFDVALTEYVDIDGRVHKKLGKTLYEVKPGKHEIMVKKDGEVVVHRVIMIGAGATKEVKIP